MSNRTSEKKITSRSGNNLAWFNNEALVYLLDNGLNDEGDVLYALIQAENLSACQKFWDVINKL